MSRASLKVFFPALLILASAGFSLYINSFWDDVNRNNILLKFSLLNTWLFYDFNDRFFLDFNFHNIHPFYLLITLAAKYISLKIITIIFMLALGILSGVVLNIGKFNFHDLVLWTVSLPFLFIANGVLSLLWIQYLLLGVFQKKTSSWSDRRLFFARIFFNVLISLIFLPGVVLTFFIEITDYLCRERGYAGLRDILYSFAVSLVILVIFHLSLAFIFFDVPVNMSGQYLILPVHMYLTKTRVNNLVSGEVLFSHILANKSLYMGIPYALAIAVFNDDRRALFIKALTSSVFLVCGIYITQGSPVFFVYCIFFILLATTRPQAVAVPKKTAILAGAVVLIFFHVIGLTSRTHSMAEVRESNVIISPADFENVRFDERKVKGVVLVDLKIIPANVEQLLSDIRSGKIEPFLNKYIMTYLDRELNYGASVLNSIENQNYAIYLKSAIHPENEKPPYRRVYEIWNKLKNSESKIILF